MQDSESQKAILLLGVILFAVSCVGCFAQTSKFVNGMNVVNPMRASAADQDALIAQIKMANVHVIRVWLTPDDKDIDFAKRVYAQGIKIELGLSPQFPANAPTRPYQPKEFPDMWGGHPLSTADPELSRANFQSTIDKLEANGIVLAGLELGNEINWAAFNAEFPLPGEGKNFGINDLYRDPEGKQIAAGFLQYIKIMAALKDVRDHSNLNQHTPIISAGLADDGPEGPWPGAKSDGVSINATLWFLRANGIDKLVDYYGIHTYPWDPTAAGRKLRLEKYAVAECQPPGSTSGKPCWITEWGIANKNLSCPLDDTARAAVVADVMNDFRELAKQGRLSGAMYFAWNSDPWAKQPNADSVYRCGALTEGGIQALQPIH
jgi:hypothetical protein